jgi:hypothetical protein
MERASARRLRGRLEAGQPVDGADQGGEGVVVRVAKDVLRDLWHPRLVQRSLRPKLGRHLRVDGRQESGQLAQLHQHDVVLVLRLDAVDGGQHPVVGRLLVPGEPGRLRHLGGTGHGQNAPRGAGRLLRRLLHRVPLVVLVVAPAGGPELSRAHQEHGSVERRPLLAALDGLATTRRTRGPCRGRGSGSRTCSCAG